MNTLTEYTYFYISKNIASYTFFYFYLKSPKSIGVSLTNSLIV